MAFKSGSILAIVGGVIMVISGFVNLDLEINRIFNYYDFGDTWVKTA